MSKKPVVLMILDGYGLNEKKDGNAVAEAKTPVMDKLMAECPFVRGNASGMAVGLPDGQMGNSEVGHLNMGAGRIVYQELTRITKEIQDGTFFENPALLDAVENCRKNDSALHLYGLVSDGGVHSHITHIYGLLELAKRNNLSKVYVHCFLDGRDTPPSSGKGYVEQLEAKMKEIGVGQVASVMGRYYAMDRDNNYDRVKLAYDALTKGEGLTAESGPAGIQASYDRNETDEFVKPTVVVKDARRWQPFRIRTLLYSSISVPTVQEKSPMFSVTMNSRALTDRTDRTLPMYAFQNMTPQSRIRKWLSIRWILQIPSASGWQTTI